MLAAISAGTPASKVGPSFASAIACVRVPTKWPRNPIPDSLQFHILYAGLSNALLLSLVVEISAC